MESNIKRHEDNIKFLRTWKEHLDESILDLQVSLAKYHSDPKAKNETVDSSTEPETLEQILQQEKSAAAVFCKLKTQYTVQAANLALTKDVVGVFATLARVDNDNLSRLLSEYLGLETMLAIVCKTQEGVKALERHDAEGNINSSAGLHALGSFIGRRIDGRFRVICLEDLRPYVGGFVTDDPQKRLDILKPKLSNGNCPPDFLDFAVNMISLDQRLLFCITSDGYGLRETLFYNLFSKLQIYRTRTAMLSALPCITDGALSLDGGMIKKNGIFALGNREEVLVKFPVASRGSDLPGSNIQIEDRIKMLRLEQAKIAEDICREQELLDKARKAKLKSEV